MTVSKITTPVTPLELIEKTNEIIDNLGQGGGGGLSYSATCPAITIASGMASWSVTHNLGTTSVIAMLYNSSGAKQECNIVVSSANAITVSFKASSNVTAGSYTIVVFASGASSDTSNLADKDFSNITNTAKSLMSAMPMPSIKSDVLALNASGSQYTAPADGYFYLRKGCNNSYQFYSVVNITKGFLLDKLFPTNWGTFSTLLPAEKGDVIQIDYNAGGTTEDFRFIYAVGSESEQS